MDFFPFIVDYIDAIVDEEDSEAILGPKENKKSFKCPHCPSKFSHKGNLPRHIAKRHDGKKHKDIDIKHEKSSNSFRGEFNGIGSHKNCIDLSWKSKKRISI